MPEEEWEKNEVVKGMETGGEKFVRREPVKNEEKVLLRLSDKVFWLNGILDIDNWELI